MAESQLRAAQARRDVRLAEEARWVDEDAAAKMLGFENPNYMHDAIASGSVPWCDQRVVVLAGGGRALQLYRSDVERAADRLGTTR